MISKEMFIGGNKVLTQVFRKALNEYSYKLFERMNQQINILTGKDFDISTDLSFISGILDDNYPINDLYLLGFECRTALNEALRREPIVERNKFYELLMQIVRLVYLDEGELSEELKSWEIEFNSFIQSRYMVCRNELADNALIGELEKICEVKVKECGNCSDCKMQNRKSGGGKFVASKIGERVFSRYRRPELTLYR